MARATGKISTDTPPSDDQGGAGNTAGPAGGRDDRTWLRELSEQHEVEVRKRYPLFAAAYEKLLSEVPADFRGEVVVRITAKVDGFRRAGIEHAGTKDHPARDFTVDQVEAILGEPLLHVEIVAVS